MESKGTSGSHDQRDLEPTITPEQSELLRKMYKLCCELLDTGKGGSSPFRSLSSHVSELGLKDFDDLAKKIVEFGLLYNGLRHVMELGVFDQISDLYEGKAGGDIVFHVSQHEANIYLDHLRSNKNIVLDSEFFEIGESLVKLAAIMRMIISDFSGAASKYRELGMVKEEKEMKALSDKQNTEEVRQLREYRLYDSADNKVKEINISIQAGLDVEGKFKREIEECKKKFKDVHIPTSEEVLTLIEEIKNRIEGILGKK